MWGGVDGGGCGQGVEGRSGVWGRGGAVERLIEGRVE